MPAARGCKAVVSSIEDFLKQNTFGQTLRCNIAIYHQQHIKYEVRVLKDRKILPNETDAIFNMPNGIYSICNKVSIVPVKGVICI